METKEQFEAIIKSLGEMKAKAEEQQKATGTITTELATKIDALQKQADALDVKLAERHAASQPDEPLEASLAKDEGLQRLIRDKSGNCVLNLNSKQHRQLMERKTNITSAAVGATTTGVLQIERIPGIVPEARQVLTISDLLVHRPTTFQIVDFVKVNAGLQQASPQTEASDKGENALTFSSVSEKVQTIATWIPASKQVLDDMTELLSFIQSTLPYYVDLEVEREMLSGTGAGATDLHGLITQATAFTTTLAPAAAGWTRIDLIGRVIQQITTAKEVAPTFIVLNPVDFWAIRLTKDSYGRYILGDPQQPGFNLGYGAALTNATKIFGLDCVVTNTIASGTFLVGSANPIAVEVRDRMGMQVEIATQHASFFTANLIAIRAEVRLALVVKRPGSFIHGTLNSSP